MYRSVGSHRVLIAAELGKFYDLRRAVAKLHGNREQGTRQGKRRSRYPAQRVALLVLHVSDSEHVSLGKSRWRALNRDLLSARHHPDGLCANFGAEGVKETNEDRKRGGACHNGSQPKVSVPLEMSSVHSLLALQ